VLTISSSEVPFSPYYVSKKTGANSLFSLLATCRIHRVNPFVYFADILRRVHTTPQQRIADLTPRGWKQLRENAAAS